MEIKKILKITGALILSTIILRVTIVKSNKVYAQTYTEQLKEQLMLVIPEVTENPNHTITFKDPGGGGVTLEIDGQGEKTIESPYELPTLGIGNHNLIFKFLDEQEVKQTIEEEIVIIPRPPELNTPKILQSKLDISGEGVAGGKIEIFLSNGDNEIREEVIIENTGSWEYSTSEELEPGKYTIIAIARKNGYASKYSEPKMFSIAGEVRGIDDHIEEFEKNTTIKLEDINPEEIPYILESNPTLAAALGLPLLIGILLGILIKVILGGGGSKKVEKLLKSNFEGDTANKLSKKKLVHKLQEKLEKSSSSKNKTSPTNNKESESKTDQTSTSQSKSSSKKTEQKPKSDEKNKKKDKTNDDSSQTDQTSTSQSKSSSNKTEQKPKSDEKNKKKNKTNDDSSKTDSDSSKTDDNSSKTNDNDSSKTDNGSSKTDDDSSKTDDNNSSKNNNGSSKTNDNDKPGKNEKYTDFIKDDSKAKDKNTDQTGNSSSNTNADKPNKNPKSNKIEDKSSDKKKGILSKNEFLKKFKIFDPDDNQGNEKKDKKKKTRNIKINISGKKEKK